MAFGFFRIKLFRTLFAIGVVSSCAVSVGVGLEAWHHERQILEDNVRSIVHTIAQLEALTADNDNPQFVDKYLENFATHSGLIALCVYDANDKLRTRWVRTKSANSCPALMVNETASYDLHGLSVSERLYDTHGYAGMVYADAALGSLAPMWIRLAGLCGFLTLLIFLESAVATKIFSDHLERATADIQSWLRSFQEKPKDFVPLKGHFFENSTRTLATAISEFRSYMLHTTVPRQQIERLRSSHNSSLIELFGTLRAGVSEDPLLLGTIADHELFLRDGLEDPGENKNYDMTSLLDRTLTSVRGTYVLSPRVHLTASMQAGMETEWAGRPELLETLFRHLLFISVQRTSAGLICLRLEISRDDEDRDGVPMLLIQLEDSGPLIQPYRLTEWLRMDEDDRTTGPHDADMSWTLVGKLFRYLRGNVSAESDEKGLRLRGLIPLDPKIADAKLRPSPIACSVKPNFGHGLMPLVLVVESGLGHGVSQSFLQKQYRVFTVASHAEAVEWAPTLPFAAVVLDTTLDDGTISSVQDLHTLIEMHLMPDIPVWAVMRNPDEGKLNLWRRNGASEIITLPLKTAQINYLLGKLKTSTDSFFGVYDASLREELPLPVKSQMPSLNGDFAVILQDVKARVGFLADGKVPDDISRIAHMAKSVALSLGYFRIAALMSRIEQITLNDSHSSMERNWIYIRESLRTTGFENSCVNVTVPPAKTSIFTNVSRHK